jgi:CubicO group peptidase (beta-lactamase class C family)
MTRTAIVAAAFAVALATDTWAQHPAGETGFATERLARIGPAYRAEVDRGPMAGAVTLIARDGRIVYFEAHGWQDAAKSRPLAKDAIFRLFSMTKPLTSVATMMLVEQGRLRLSDPIEEWMPEFKEMKVMVERREADGTLSHATVSSERSIRVQDLLRHTAGFACAGCAPQAPLNDAYKAAGLEWAHFETSDELIRRLASLPLTSQPGSRFQYGYSTEVLGVLLERLTGRRLDVLLEDMIFKPLAMKDTGFHLDAAGAARLADALDSDPRKAQAWEWSRIELDPARRSFRWGGSGAVSTATDYFRFCQMLLNGGELEGVRLLGRKTVEQMLADQLHEANPGLPVSGVPASFIDLGAKIEAGSESASGFGLGFGVRRRDGRGSVPGSAGQVSWSSYSGSTFLIDPKESIVALSMAESPSGWRRLFPMFHNLLWGSYIR